MDEWGRRLLQWDSMNPATAGLGSAPLPEMVVRLPLSGVYQRIPGSLATTAAGQPVEMIQSAVSRLYSSVYSGEPVQDPFVHARDAIRFRHAMESRPCVSEKTIQLIRSAVFRWRRPVPRKQIAGRGRSP